ncbi:hypothetical protein HYDPIDRAFT_79270 [Hydnomerulius pinastri MD-312]|nr:hypothetical protein HYDPIDRAFT_79270 [Hydnomerulius pinastri MD-312]
MFEIEWKSSHYHSDGRRRSRPKASTVHGWLVKWRATFSGNERLRKEGIHEMREAKAVRELKKQRKAARRAKKGSSGLWSFSFGQKKRPQRPSVLSRGSQHSSSRRVAGTQRVTSPTHSKRSTPATSRRSSSNRQGGHKPHSSRQASYSSGRGVVRATKTK